MLLPKRRPMRYFARRSSRYLRCLRPLLWLLFVLFFLDSIYTIFTRPVTTRRIRPTTASAQGNWTVYVVSVHRNTERVQRAAWNDAVEELARYLGPSRMFFSAVESGSQDGTKAQLKDLRTKLDMMGIENNITLGMTVTEQLRELSRRPAPDPDARKEGWIWNPHDKWWDLRRIPYLSKVRNLAMKPLHNLEANGRKFDRILWLNDVVFDTEDVVTLLNTRHGAYAAACSMDYKQPPYYYDTFALRDDRGDKAASFYWPWFLSSGSRAKAQNLEPVPVKSCWNGVVAFDSRPFYSLATDFPPPGDDYQPGALEHLIKRSTERRSNGNKEGENKENAKGNVQKRNEAATAPGTEKLEFRGISDSLADMHLEGSECCLIHADNPLSEDPDYGVWLNPNVRVGYSPLAYEAVRKHWGGGNHARGNYPTAMDAFIGSWSNRWWRWRGAVQHTLEKRTVYTRLRHWMAEGEIFGEHRTENGDFCLINEMQIMWSNGWRHL